MEEKRNLCAMIPAELHTRVRQEQEALGQTLGAYMEQILRTHFEKKEVEKMDNIRTIAFQVPEEVFWELKAYLEAHKLKQKDFMLSLIRRALDEDGQQPDEGNVPDA